MKTKKHSSVVKIMKGGVIGAIALGVASVAINIAEKQQLFKSKNHGIIKTNDTSKTEDETLI